MCSSVRTASRTAEIAAETKAELLTARDEIVALKKRNTELQAALEKAQKRARAAKAPDVDAAADYAIATVREQGVDLDTALSSISTWSTSCPRASGWPACGSRQR